MWGEKKSKFQQCWCVVKFQETFLPSDTFSWIFSCLSKADKDKDGQLSQSDIKNFMRLINMEVDDSYAEMLFKVIVYKS